MSVVSISRSFIRLSAGFHPLERFWLFAYARLSGAIAFSAEISLITSSSASSR